MNDLTKQFQELISKLSLPCADLYITGDGSGTVLGKPCGSAIVTYHPDFDIDTKIHTCCYSNGTNNWAELVLFIEALNYDLLMYGDDNKRLVECITDSELTARCGNRQYQRKCNMTLWAAVDYFETINYRIHWNHVPRNSNPINALCDKLAGETRKSFQKHLTDTISSGTI